jgi:hypothetical protein
MSYAIRSKHSNLGGTVDTFLAKVRCGGLSTHWALDSRDALTWPTRAALDAFRRRYPLIRGRVVRV